MGTQSSESRGRSCTPICRVQTKELPNTTAPPSPGTVWPTPPPAKPSAQQARRATSSPTRSQPTKSAPPTRAPARSRTRLLLVTATPPTQSSESRGRSCTPICRVQTKELPNTTPPPSPGTVWPTPPPAKPSAQQARRANSSPTRSQPTKSAPPTRAPARSRTRLLLVTATPPTQSLHLHDRDKVRALANRCRSPWLHMCSWRGIDVCSAGPYERRPTFWVLHGEPIGAWYIQTGQRPAQDPRG